MAKDEQTVISDLISKWVSLGMEYSRGAEGVTGVYVYAAAEDGEKYANIFFEQDGVIDYPEMLKGVPATDDRIRQVHRLQLSDLRDAERELREMGVPCPTEYRIFFEVATGRMQSELSYEPKFADHPTKIMEQGPADWLGDRIRKVFETPISE